MLTVVSFLAVYSVRHRMVCMKVSVFYNTTKYGTNLDRILLWGKKKGKKTVEIRGFLVA